jgi:hypothetical protein
MERLFRADDPTTQIDLADCDEGEFASWYGRYRQGPGQVDRVYIIDVDSERLVLDMSWMLDSTNADRSELQAIVDSIEIQP